METRPEESVKNFLLLFLDDAEAERFADHNYVAGLIEEGQLSWQVLAAIGGHVSNRYAYALLYSDHEKAVLQDLVARTRAPIETLVESLTTKASGTLEDEEKRLLFHARFALGFLLLSSDDKERAKHILHEVAGTKVSARGREWRSGPGILLRTSDVNAVKWEIAYSLLGGCTAAKNYEEATYLIIEAAACDPTGVLDKEILEDFPLLLDLWAAQCEKEDSSGEWDYPTLLWLDLFAAAAEALAAYGEADTSGALPNECPKGSAQFLAWEFGQLAARLCTHERWREGNFASAWDRLGDESDAIWDEDCEFTWGREKTSQAHWAVMGLVCEYGLQFDWQNVRQRHLYMWKYSYSSAGLPMSEIGPGTDLYWAMRIGFADKVLERPTTAIQPVALDTILTRSALEAAKTRNLVEAHLLPLLEERLPPAPREIREFVLKHMGSVRNKLPVKVVDTLTQAEMYHRSGVHCEEAKVWFCKAVEASFSHCFVVPLLSSMQERHLMKFELPFSDEQGGPRRLAPKQIERMNPAQWSDVLEMTIASFDNKGFAPLIAHDFKAFLSEHLGTRVRALRPLIAAMREVWQCRGGSAHYESSEARYEKERQDLDRMRELVLGLGNSKSVIVQIFELLGTEDTK